MGRQLAGRIADHFGRLNTLIVAVVLTFVWLFGLFHNPFRRYVPLLYLFSYVLASHLVSFISLAPMCIRQISKTNEIGLQFMTLYQVVSFS